MEYINQMLSFQKVQDLSSFIEIGSGLFVEMLRKQYSSLNVKKQFVSVRKEIEINAIRISSKEVAFKKSFLFNFCNKV